MGRSKTVFVCQECGHVSPKWVGRCPECLSWHTLVEEQTGGDAGGWAPKGPAPEVMPLDQVTAGQEFARIPTGISELDRALGGGMVPGGLVLLGGEPGIGKSTLLLQVLANCAAAGGKVLYVSGEESASQIRMRAERLGPIPASLYVLAETSLEPILSACSELDPAVVVFDSIQTMATQELASAPGSVGQIREVTARIMQFTKERGNVSFVVGHVTKEGSIAGPRILEHLVDTVLYFEGERSSSFRIVRAVKNRFGPTHEIGVFEMRQSGLIPVDNPSELFLSSAKGGGVGSVVVPCIEGSRPLLVEIQALAAPSYLAMPRRTAIGVETSRMALLIAIMERHLGVQLYDRDVFVNVVGGLRIGETAADLAVIAALQSSLVERPVPPRTVFFGEVGLTGEVRPVGRMELRLQEAARLGMAQAVLPRHKTQFPGPPEVKGIPIGHVRELKELV